jgi:hypothetical protein
MKGEMSVKKKKAEEDAGAKVTKGAIESVFNKTQKATECIKVMKAPSKVNCIRKLKRFLSNSRIDLVSLVRSGYMPTFRVKANKHQMTMGKAYTGLTVRMKDVFYPAGGDENDKEYRKRREASGAHNLVKRLKSGCSVCGKEHGTLVHQQVEDYVNILVMNGAVGSFFKKHPVPDPCFVRFVKVCEVNGWVPIASELAIYDERMRVATGIDLIAIDLTDFSIVLLDMKTGYENMSYMQIPSDGTFEYPLDSVADCPMNRHALQLFITRMILKVNYDGFDPEKFRVVRVCPKQKAVKVYEMPTWFYDKALFARVYSHMLRETQKVARNESP